MAARIVRTIRHEGWEIGGRPLIPVPTTAGRLRARGYNQAEVLAVEISKLLGTPIVHGLARREGGGSQINLDRGGRRENVRSAFFAMDAEMGQLKGTEVVLVDDVLTTGATALAAADVLVGAGVGGVHLLTFARTLPE